MITVRESEEITMEMHTCAITGHRPNRFKFKHKENTTGCKRLKRRIKAQLEWLYAQGVRDYWVGGALGVDMWAGEILLRMKEQAEFSKLKLHIALPGPEHDQLWDERSKTRMAFLIQHSAECVVVGAHLTPADYRKRNQYMVDHADVLLAVYDNDRSIRSGTGTTVNYAVKKKGLPVIFIHPDSHVVTACGFPPVFAAAEEESDPPPAISHPD